MLELINDRMGIGAPREFLGQCSRERGRHRRLDQELTDLLALAGEDLLDEVVGNGAAASGEVLDQRRRIRMSGKGHAGKSDTRCPALRSVHQCRQIVRLEA
ncbi:hypothetical protein P9209_00685 [Prescottella defluvii]|nr:hypothetical protein P9209_00685 [Prescottella defluvii]